MLYICILGLPSGPFKEFYHTKTMDNLNMKILAAIVPLAIMACGCGHTHHHEHGHTDEHTHVHTDGHDHDHEAGHEHAKAHEHTDAHGHSEAHHHDEGATCSEDIHVSIKRQEEFGIKTDTVRVSEFREVIRTSGEILAANDDEMSITAPSPGIVTFSSASLTEGTKVGSGSTVAFVSTKNISGGDALTKARLAFEKAEKEYHRDIQLRQDNIISESHFDESKMAYEQARNEYEAIASKESPSGLKVTTPMTGYIKQLYVTSGEYVETGQTIATVTRNNRLRLKVLVSEKYYDKLPSITDANFKTAYGDKTFSVKEMSGRIVSFGRNSGEANMIPVIFEFNNTGNLISGSFVEAFLLSKPSGMSVAVPAGALTEDQGEYYVYIQEAPEVFVRRKVTPGASDGMNVRILDGLSEGEVIVTKGTVDVKLSAFTGVPSGHNHQH